MRRTNTLDITGGRPLRLLFDFAVPPLIGNIVQLACNLADARS